MIRQDKPALSCARLARKSRPPEAWLMGLAGLMFASGGCHIVAGLEDLKLAPGANEDGGAGSGGSNGSGSNASSAVSSSSGAPIMGDIACGESICPVGPESACCADHFKSNSEPFQQCVNGPPSNDGCNTAGGANGYETRIECQLPAHCPQGTVCCGNLDTIALVYWYAALSCATTCAWPDTVVCDPMSSTNDCPMVNHNGAMQQTTCMPNELLPVGYGVCSIAP